MASLEDIVGKSLTGFSVIRMTEVYRTNEDGRFTKSEGCFTSEVMARAYANGLADSSYTSTREVLVLTDGKVGYSLDESVVIADEGKVLESIRGKALSKLTPDEIKVLGFG